LPVLWSDDRGDVVAASHAGWRGLLGQGGAGILESTLAGLRAQRPQAQWHAWLGPCIGPRAFEVGAEVKAAFVADSPQAASHFRPSPWHEHRFVADLPGMARDRLARAGVQHVWGNDGSDNWCTVTQSERFFSHRRDGQTPGLPAGTGRMAALIWR
jgi:copper oxidase (laccase) domain-containing protein